MNCTILPTFGWYVIHYSLLKLHFSNKRQFKRFSWQKVFIVLKVSFLTMSTTKRTTSSWRQYFHVDNKSGNAKCKYCPKILKTCSNTTNLKQHMERKHSGIISIANKEVSTYNLDLITIINYKETGPLSKLLLLLK